MGVSSFLVCLYPTYIHKINGDVIVLKMFFFYALQNWQAFQIIALICACLTYIYKIYIPLIFQFYLSIPHLHLRPYPTCIYKINGVIIVLKLFCLCLTYIYKIDRYIKLLNRFVLVLHISIKLICLLSLIFICLCLTYIYKMCRYFILLN